MITAKNQKSKWLLWFLLIFLIHFRVAAQNDEAVVTGTVVNESGELLAGVNISASDAASKENYTALTNGKGIFTFHKMKVGGTYSFIASYVGYEADTVNSFSVKQGNNSIFIKLQPSNNILNQVVVIGYGTQKRETVTGSIATVTAKDFNTGQINDPMTLIAGKVAGLSTSNTSRSDPNATADFSLRGPATVEGNSQPLIVIDGVPGGDLQTIAPSDIAS